LRQKIEKKTVVHLIKCGRPPEQLKLQFQAHAMPDQVQRVRVRGGNGESEMGRAVQKSTQRTKFGTRCVC